MPGIYRRQKVMTKNTWNIWKTESKDKECLEYMEDRVPEKYER